MVSVVKSIRAGRFPWVVIPAASCCFQLLWFGVKCLGNIDFDGISYVGMARHLSRGHFYAAINAFRSPLLSWLIVSLSWVTSDFVSLGKLLTITSCVGCVVLLYKFTEELWGSPLAAAIAALWFTLGRGVLALSVLFVTPDFLLTFLVLAYFWTLLRCFRSDSKSYWFYLGAIHALAFFAKSFALPWLGITSLLAICLSSNRAKEAAARVALAAIIPTLVVGSWAFVLHMKYGTLTTGDQFRTNILQWTLHEKWPAGDKGFLVLRDESKNVDEYMVGDPLPPGSPFWQYHYTLSRLVPAILSSEVRNIPLAIREILVVFTPGGTLAFALATIALRLKRQTFPVEFRIALTVLAGSVTLVLAYCMLVFDGRYVLPVIPLLIAISVRFLLPNDTKNDPLALPWPWQRISLAFIVVPIIFFLGYRPSPFRNLTRNFQASCYKAAQELKSHSARNIVTIGSGPYPEHGVGWEAGYTTAFLAGARVVASADQVPGPNTVPNLMLDVRKAAPDALIVWGKSEDLRYTELEHALTERYPGSSPQEITDLTTAKVGAIYFLANEK
jgi:hypothetical protein